MKRKQQQGFSLIEVMIASFVGMLIIAAVFEVYLSVSTTYKTQHALARIQENGRFISFYLSRFVRMSGYQGCENPQHPVNSSHAIRGYQAFLGKIATGTDSLVVATCLQHKGKIAWHKMGFYIAQTQYRNAMGQPVKALYQKIKGSSAQQLITGIATMQIRFGVLNPHQKLVFLPASKIYDWQAVKSVEIDVLLQSLEPVLTVPYGVTFLGQHYQPSRRLRKPWHIILTLREPLVDISKG